MSCAPPPPPPPPPGNKSVVCLPSVSCVWNSVPDSRCDEPFSPEGGGGEEADDDDNLAYKDILVGPVSRLL